MLKPSWQNCMSYRPWVIESFPAPRVVPFWVKGSFAQEIIGTASIFIPDFKFQELTCVLNSETATTIHFGSWNQPKAQDGKCRAASSRTDVWFQTGLTVFWRVCVRNLVLQTELQRIYVKQLSVCAYIPRDESVSIHAQIPKSRGVTGGLWLFNNHIAHLHVESL